MKNQEPLILMVDDDPDFAEIVRHVLEAEGYRVACSHEPEDALNWLEQDRPSLVITDLMMQSLDSGFTLAKRMEDHPEWRDIPVIILTAASARRGFDFTPRSRDDLKAMHADAFLAKPVTPEQLLAKVRELLAAKTEERPSSTP
jgi:two-component system KDP operon response regulator KdpE